MPSEQEQAQQLREQGNALYKSGKLRQAIDIYQKTLQLTPEDYRPLSNLSAVHSELGEYASCSTYGIKALGIVIGSDETTALPKIVVRVVKAHLYLKEYDIARQIINTFKNFPIEREFYTAAIEHGEAVNSAFSDERQLRKKIQSDVPSYRPAISTNRECYNLGHDNLQPLLEESVIMDEYDVSVFLGGVGDARNLNGTWFLFNIFEEASKRVTGISSKKYHFTINDIKPVVLARNLVLFSMLDDLAVNTHLSEIERLERLSIVYYVFATQIMPRFAFDHLYKVIDSIIETLETKAPVIPWVRVYDTDKPLILDALRAWKSTDLLNLTSTGKLISQTVSTMMTDDMGRFDLQGSEPNTIPKGCETEFHCYNKTLLLRAPPPVLKKHDPELLKLLDSDASIPALRDHLDKNWHVNTTFLDDDWHLKESWH
ncbi:hypothetical protein AWENTII_009458 [Aspergillus wentii]|nr:hypothetical protein MW887_001171 [Aspergillus wentii]